MASLFIFDALSGLFFILLVLVGLPSLFYARMQLKATASKTWLLAQMSSLLLLLALLGAASNIALFAMLWSGAPILLTPMITAFRSNESDYSAWQAFFYLESGALLLLLCQLGFPEGATWAEIHLLSITPQVEIALLLIIVACAIQSGLFPAHRWLMNSLCAPTAVSALMHAGFINVSGLLLLRVAPLLSRSYLASFFLLCLGVLSIAIGILMSAIQVEQKRSLACSTVAQMGCVFVYAALGLHSLVVAHLLTHAMYKAYSFLGMGFTLTAKRSQLVTNKNRGSNGKGYLGACIALIFAYGLGDFATQSETVFAIFLGYLGYQIGAAPLSVPIALAACAISGFSLMLWHQIFASFLPGVPTLIGIEGIVIVLGAAGAVVGIPYLPMSWQRRLYSYILQMASADTKALTLSRQSAQGDFS